MEVTTALGTGEFDVVEVALEKGAPAMACTRATPLSPTKAHNFDRQIIAG
jgi:hypothetical protein